MILNPFKMSYKILKNMFEFSVFIHSYNACNIYVTKVEIFILYLCKTQNNLDIRDIFIFMGIIL